LFVCRCVLYYCRRVATQLQLTNISNLCYSPLKFYIHIQITHKFNTYLTENISIRHPNYKILFSKIINMCKGKGKVNPCTGTEALYRPYGP